MKKSTKTTLILLGAGTAAAGVCAAAVRELYCFTFMRQGSPLITAVREKTTVPGHDQAYYDHRDGLKEKVLQMPQIRMTMPSARGETLAGFYFPCEGSDGSRIAYIVHGYRSEHAETVGMYMDF